MTFWKAVSKEKLLRAASVTVRTAHKLAGRRCGRSGCRSVPAVSWQQGGAAAAAEVELTGGGSRGLLMSTPNGVTQW